MIRGFGYAATAALLAGIASPASAFFHHHNKCGGCESACASPCEIKGEACASPCESKCEEKCEVKCKQARADIERLHAVKGKCDDQICVKYAVEIAETTGEQFDLVLQIKDRCDKVVWEKVVALDCPRKANCHEEKYKAAVGDVIAQCTFDERLKIEGNVVYRGSRTSIDRERERVHRSDRGILASAADVAYQPVRWVTE
jgi:hypothetical protein